MHKIKSFDIVKMVADDVEKECDNVLAQGSNQLYRVEQCCNIIDNIIDRFDGTSYTVKIKPEKYNIVIRIELQLFEITNPKDEFYELLINCKKFAVEASEKSDTGIIAEFTMGGIWSGMFVNK